MTRTTPARSAGPAPAGPRDLRIVNRKGLHARASALFVETVKAFDARVRVERAGERVDGDDLLGLLMLAASQGTTIRVWAEGSEAGAALGAIEALVSAGFNEGE